MTIAEQGEYEWLLDTHQPDPPGHAPAHAVVDLSAKNVLVETPGHGF